MMRNRTFAPRDIVRVLQVLVLGCFLTASWSCRAQEQPETSAALRVRISNRIVLGEADLRRMKFSRDAAAIAAFRKNVVPLERGQSVQLRIELIDVRGVITDVTRSVQYESLSPWKLAVTPNGLVGMLPSEATPSMPAGSSEVGDTAIVVSHGASGAWNKIFFNAEY